MLAEHYRIDTPDGHSIFARHWFNKNNNTPRALIHILHGMAEHSERYDYFANKLVNAGFEVIAHDHRGHGNSVAKKDDLGHYADSHGWEKVVNDVLIVQDYAKQKLPEIPVVLFSHSMGSFIGQAFALKYSDRLSGLIISGSNYNPPKLYKFMHKVAWMERLRLGRRGRSALLNYLSFGSFNRPFAPTRTAFDWLSRDPTQVDKYINDPNCGYTCTTQTWIEFIKGLIIISNPKNLRQINAKLPIYMFYGENDPVSGPKHSVEILRQKLQTAGVTDVTSKMYPNGRHEMLNEINRDEVINDTLIWLNSHFAAYEKN